MMSNEVIQSIYNEYEQIQNNVLERKERRGASYVWNYCEKLSRHTVRCKLCNKIMSFHGTANVITHLQRRHNVLGDPPNQVNNSQKQMANNLDTTNPIIYGHDIYENGGERNAVCTDSKIVNTPASVVWKYCTRISQDQVRCCFCNKNLSYQGTSNLQRHLHRMHGVVTHGRIKVSTPLASSSNNFTMIKDQLNLIWHFTSLKDSDTKIKCNMCEAIFSEKDIEPVVKHLSMFHSVNLSQKWIAKNSHMVNHIKKYNQDGVFERSDENDYNLSKCDEGLDKKLLNIIQDDSIYDDIIEEDLTEDHELGNQTEYSNCSEDQLHSKNLHDDDLHDNLSPNNSSSSSSAQNNPKHYVNYPNQHEDLLSLLSSSLISLIDPLKTKTLLKLQEDRLRMETEYYREKASYYRMQKYLTILQAKKLRSELECLNRGESKAPGAVSSAALNDPYTTIDVDFNNHLDSQ